MTDFDSKLAQNQPQPTRPLSPDFTSRVLTRIVNEPRPATGFAKVKEHMKMLVKKPAFVAAITAAVLLGGTAYATSDGFTKVPDFLQAVLGKTETLQNGDRIVQVNADCMAKYYDTGSLSGDTADKTAVYYRVQKDSTLTADQVVATVQGICENAAWSAKWNPIMQDLRQQYGEVYGGAPSEKVVTVGANGLTVTGVNERASAQDLNVRQTLNYTITYVNLVNGVQVYSPDMQPIKLSDITPGQHVQIAYQGGTSGLWDEYAMGTTVNHDPIVAVFIISENTANMFNIWDKYGFELQQVTPCADDHTAWCTADGTKQSTDAVTPVTITGTETPAAKVVRDAYTAHMQYMIDMAAASSAQPSGVDGFFHYATPRLQSKLQSAGATYDQIVCAQNIPQSITITYAGNSRVMAVTHWAASSDQEITLQVNADNKIESLTCPAP